MEQTTKTIRFSLEKNNLPVGEGKGFRARVRGRRTVYQNEIIEIMSGMNASVSRQEIIVVMDLLKDVIATILLTGNRVKTDLFRAGVSIKGTFEQKDSEFDAAQHEIKVRMIPEIDLQKSVKDKALLKKVKSAKPMPEIESIYDYESLKTNKAVTPGHTAEVKGQNIFCDAADEQQGVFFVSSESKAETKVGVIHKKTAGTVVFRVPELEAGNYKLVLKCGFGSKIRTGVLEETISVN